MTASQLCGAADSADVSVSVDERRRRGFTSLAGVIATISIDSGKVLDTAILSKSCKGNTRMQPIKAKASRT